MPRLQVVGCSCTDEGKPIVLTDKFMIMDKQIRNDIRGLLDTNHSDAYIQSRMYAKWNLNYSLERIDELIEQVKTEIQLPDKIGYKEEPEGFEMININKGSYKGIVYNWCSPTEPNGWCGWIKD